MTDQSSMEVLKMVFVRTNSEEVRCHIHYHVILIVKLIANLLHSNASTAISGHQKLLASWVHLGWGGIFNHAEAVYQVEIDQHRSSSSQQPHKCCLGVTKSCKVTSDCRDTFSIVKTPQTHQDLGRMAFPIHVLTVFSPSMLINWSARDSVRPPLE